MNCLLNIRNWEDTIASSFVTWHLAYSQCLFENLGWRMRMNPETSSPNPMTHQPVGDFDMPMAFNQIPRFQNLNKVQINVFRYRKKDLIPLRTSKRQELPFILDFLFLRDGQVYHYVLIQDLKILVNSLKQVPRSSSELCRYCFHVYCTAEIYETHFEACIRNEATTIKLPDETKNYLQFGIYQCRWFAPYVMYFDFESLTKPVATCSNTFW